MRQVALDFFAPFYRTERLCPPKVAAHTEAKAVDILFHTLLQERGHAQIGKARQQSIPRGCLHEVTFPHHDAIEIELEILKKKRRGPA